MAARRAQGGVDVTRAETLTAELFEGVTQASDHLCPPRALNDQLVHSWF